MWTFSFAIKIYLNQSIPVRKRIREKSNVADTYLCTQINKPLQTHVTKGCNTCVIRRMNIILPLPVTNLLKLTRLTCLVLTVTGVSEVKTNVIFVFSVENP